MVPEVGELEFAERRRSRNDLSPIDTLREMPAVVVLERLPVPVVAVAQDGSILFANKAFAAMLGHSPAAVLRMKFAEVFRTLPDGEGAVTAVRSHADDIVELAHHDGTVVRAKMSKSALMRGDDRVALATFVDLTEKLWIEEP